MTTATLDQTITAIRQLIANGTANRTDYAVLADAYEESGDEPRARYWRYLADVGFGHIDEKRLALTSAGKKAVAKWVKLADIRCMRGVNVYVGDEVILYGMFWDGGSRNYYFAVPNDNVSMIQPTGTVFHHTTTKRHLGRGDGILRLAIYCGKPCRPTLTMNPLALEKLYV